MLGPESDIIPITMMGMAVDKMASSTYRRDRFRMNKVDARKSVRKLAESDRIAFTEHARKRDPARGKFPLTREQVRNCLIHGVITEGPSQDIKEPNGWKMRITRVRDQEEHEVVCVLVVDKNVLIITGYGYGRRQR